MPAPVGTGGTTVIGVSAKSSDLKDMDGLAEIKQSDLFSEQQENPVFRNISRAIQYPGRKRLTLGEKVRKSGAVYRLALPAVTRRACRCRESMHSRWERAGLWRASFPFSVVGWNDGRFFRSSNLALALEYIGV